MLGEGCAATRTVGNAAVAGAELGLVGQLGQDECVRAGKVHPASTAGRLVFAVLHQGPDARPGPFHSAKTNAATASQILPAAHAASLSLASVRLPWWAVFKHRKGELSCRS